MNQRGGRMKLIESNKLIKHGLTMKIKHLNQRKSNTRTKLTKSKQEQNMKQREKEKTKPRLN